ncbi:MAG TPA: RICIN domain-containing protein [Pyrinomonadaceae bacterium]|nr:RICIN domain-containing protein [Pyrinomonadaceae bacterium]
MRPRTLLPLVVTVLLLLMIYQSPRHHTHAHAFVAVPAPAPDLFDSGSFYRLTTLFQGECKSLDIVNDGRNNNQPILAKTANVSGQYWKITSLGGGYYRLTTQWQGEGKSLDILNDGRKNNQPFLGRTGNFSGQFWRITPLGNDIYRLTTQWQGPGKSLDIVNDGRANNKPILAATGNFSGQTWHISLAKFVTAPPASLQLNSFYRQYLDADGIPVISSGRVPVEALYRVRFMALQMLSRIPQAKAEMIRHGARIAVMSKDEQTLDIPEHAFLKDDHSVPDWNARARGLGGTVAVPTGSCAEENVMCYAGDRYHDEDIFIHEFSHSIHKLGLVFAFPEFQTDLQRAYSYAIRHARWIMTYAASNSDEYFAEGVQDWFNVNAERNPPDGVHNFVNTRAELKTYDPNLYNLLKRYFPEDDNKCTCH